MVGTAKIAVFASFSGEGGVERMIVNLCRGIVAAGHPVDLVLVRSESAHLERLPDGVRLVRLGVRHNLASLVPLVRYLRRERPAAVLAAKDRAGRIAILARWLARVRCRLVIRIGTTPSAALVGRSRLVCWARYLPMRLLYRHADAIVAVSVGVAADLQQITGLSPGRLHVIANPVITPSLGEMAGSEVEHPWLQEREGELVVAIGRLTRQKDFPTLLRAFAKAAQHRTLRLLILGDGRDRQALQQLSAQLGIADRVDFAGFQANPYPYLRQADLFVLSSAWEGSPNALTEALALGVPVVATDCPSGPREILRGGEVAPLVPVGDADRLAAAMRAVLENPPDPSRLQAAVTAYTMEASSRHYLDLLRARD